MIAFIDDHREVHEVEPICKLLPIAPSTHHAHKARQSDPQRRSARAPRDEKLLPEVERVWNENFRVYGVRKLWRQLRREGFDVARCTVVAGYINPRKSGGKTWRSGNARFRRR